MPRLQAPAWVTTALGLAAGLLSALNLAVFGFASPWHIYVSLALLFVGSLGVGPLLGEKFRAALHIPMNVSIMITAAITVLATGVTAISGLDADAKAVLVGLLTTLSYLGFAPIAPPVAAKARRRRA